MRAIVRLTIPAVAVILVSSSGHSQSMVSPLSALNSSVQGLERLRRFGIALNFYYQDQSYEVVDLQLSLPNPVPTAALDIDVQNRISELDLRLDYWLFPFLNAFGLIGALDGNTMVNLPSPLDNLDLDYDGVIYGGGVVLAVGFEDFFATVTGTLIQTDLRSTSSSVDARVLVPRVGFRAGRVALWLGGMYQEADERHSGQIEIPGLGEVGFDVELMETQAWSVLGGIVMGFGEHWYLEVEGGTAARNIARVSGAHITGLTINHYQVERCKILNNQSSVDHLLDVKQGDFMNIPFPDNAFDKMYAIEALCHAPSVVDVYKQILNKLKPGGKACFYEWAMTDKYDPTNPEHVKIKEMIEYGNSITRLGTISEIDQAIYEAGFVKEETIDLGESDYGNDVPWYTTLQSGWSISQIRHTKVSRTVMSYILRTLEALGIVKKGVSKTQKILLVAADGLVAGGKLGIFTPMYMVVVSKRKS